MNPLAKLKEQARSHELREEWKQAATLYLQVLREAEDSEVGELALFNRVGDLHLRMGDAEEAVGYYEQAADRYAEAGLFNNAIALCNKALRYAPTRMDLLRKLGHFSASQGFLTDARRWFLEYAERSIRAGDPDAAVAALDEYSVLAEDAEPREIIARRLLAGGRRDAALGEFRKAYGMRIEQGQTEAAAALQKEIRDRFPGVDEIIFRPRPAAEGASRRVPEPKPTAADRHDDAADPGDLAPPVGLPGFDDRRDASAAADESAAQMPGLEQTALTDGRAAAGQGTRPEGLETTRVADAPDLGAAGNGTAAAAAAADDMDWVRGRHSNRAGSPPSRPSSPSRETPVRDDYVDLSELLGIGEEGEKETRWFVEESEPTGDEDRDFAELLSQFKEKLAEHIAHDDAGAHYDLGIAFKEMGLLDEAISEFQVALRGNGHRLKILEELGHCFFLKNHHSVAIKVLKRALELETDDELEMIGVYYYLGRAFEEQGQPEQARDAYERVVGLDINFQDVADRMARL